MLMAITVALSDADVPESPSTGYTAVPFARGQVHAAAVEHTQGRLTYGRA